MDIWSNLLFAKFGSERIKAVLDTFNGNYCTYRDLRNSADVRQI